MSDNIKVVVKVRPLISREIEEKLFHQWRVKNYTIYQVDQNGKDCGNSFTFDKVYDENTQTTDVYNDIAKPIVEAATTGFNGTIFAYGQTSSGKTYTMTGTEESPGIIPLAVINLFDIIKTIPGRDFLVRVSYVEIYNEMLIDLLNTEKKNIKIHDTLQGVKVDATVKVTTSPEEVLQFMREGQANRQTGSTNMNEESSRSHSIFQIIIESREHTEGEDVGCLNVSQLNLVDLAGSERSGQTGATGIRFKEGTHINKSLSSLALVIKQLSEGLSKHVSYRDSKLTRILQNSLGGNAKTSIICAITPAALEETISTLQFAYRAKAIKNNPEVNVVATDSKMIDNLTKQLSLLKTQLESKRNVEVDNHKLQKQISMLQRFLSGLGQRSSAEIMSGSRRKNQQLRRATISTPHLIQEDQVPSVPRFCTPSLKYNPMSLASSSEFLPIQNASSLASVPEEPARLVTPPPLDHRITLNNEIIELDSDDDVPMNVPTCSPYHKCFESSKTPPCVLRKNAIEAEKNFKDLVELTEREKIYTPNVVELIEKLEQNTSVIAKLEDDLIILKKKKNSEVETLRCKISKAEEEVRNLTSTKVQLEGLCQDYTTKLTDWEVTYDTLKKKAKTREEELLLRLEEFADSKKSGKQPRIALFQDTPKDVSIVSSNNHLINDCSIGSTNNESELMPVELITNLKDQLAVRDIAILELEARLHAQNQKVTFLDSKTLEIETLLNVCEEKLCKSEEENSSHKSTIKTLNCIIQNQNSNLESATKDIKSYINTIEELQYQLSKKQNQLKITLNDTEIQSLIVNEDKIIANNENIRNIIQSMQVTLDSKNHEIEILKSTLQKNKTSGDNHTNADELEIKQKQIAELKEKVQTLTLELEDSNSQIEKLLSQRNNLLAAQVELNNKISNYQKNEIELGGQIKVLETELNIIKENNQALISNLNKKLITETELTDQVENQLKNIENLENDLILKDAQILSINSNGEETKYIHKIIEAICKLQDFLSLLTDKSIEYQDINNSSQEVFKALDDKLYELESRILEIVNQTNTLTKQNIEFKTAMINMGKHVITEMTSINTEIDMLQEDTCYWISNKTVSEITPLNDNEVKKNVYLRCNNNEKILDGGAENVIQDMEIQCSPIELKVLSLNLKEKIQNIKSKSHSSFVELTQKLQSKFIEIDELDLKLNNLKAELEDKSQQILALSEEKTETMKDRDEFLNNISLKVTKIGCELNIDDNLSCLLKNQQIYTNNQIITMLEKILSHVFKIKSIHIQELSTNKVLLDEANKKIRNLTEHNIGLIDNLSQVNRTNSDLTLELQELRQSSKTLSEDLNVSSLLLNELKDELKMKAHEIECMESKVLKLKSQFSDLTSLMKKQQHDMQVENEKLKEKCLLLKREYINKAEVNVTNDEQRYVTLQPNQSKIVISPQSLLTISCNKIIEIIQHNENTCQSVTLSNSNSSVYQENSVCSESYCDNNKLKAELKLVQHKNLELVNELKELQCTNENLMKEMKEAFGEMKSLLDFTSELQKRIFNHRTNLSTLTATAYAENKSLSSRVKFLEHHHTRFHTVCQRDLPEVKKQLHELMKLLKEESLEKSLNVSFKRYSLPNPIDRNSIMYSFKNESTMDGDLLMLDTNVTLAMSADNTLTGLDETCLEVTQACLSNDVACQTTACWEISEFTSSSHESFSVHSIKVLKEENQKFNDLIMKSEMKQKLDAETSPHKRISDKNLTESNYCENCDHKTEQWKQLVQELEKVNQNLENMTSLKDDIEKKYNNLSLEIPCTDALLRKLHNFERELENKSKEIEKLSTALKCTKEQFKTVEVENDSLSTQIMDFIFEIDNLKKELDIVKKTNPENTQEVILPLNEDNNKEETSKVECPECIQKDQHIKDLESKYSNTHTRLNRSYSDSDSSSRYNKICTLQNELDAGREDCNELKEEVSTIKNHLEHSNLSISQAMDLDDSIGDSNVVDSETNKCLMPKISEERESDIYTVDKLDCFNYYIETVGDEKTTINSDLKIIDVMKMLSSKLMAKHDNKLKHYKDSQRELLEKLDNVSKCLEESHSNVQRIEKKLSIVRNNCRIFCNDITSTNVIESFKNKVLMVLDMEFSINCVTTFEAILELAFNKNFNLLNETMDKYVKLDEYSRKLTDELKTAHDSVTQLRSQLNDKDNECNLLIAHKEKTHEIINAVTMDIVKKEQDFSAAITEGYRKLAEENVLKDFDVDPTLPSIKNLFLLFKRIINQINLKTVLDKERQIDILLQKVTEYKMLLENKNIELQALTEEFEKIKGVNQSITKQLQEEEAKLKTQKSLSEDLSAIYNKKIEENNINLVLIQKLTEEISILKESSSSKEKLIQNLQADLNIHKSTAAESESKVCKLLQDMKSLLEEIKNLKCFNQNLSKEKESMGAILEKSEAIIKQNKMDLEKMESDILVLKESAKENVILIKSLKLETKSLKLENVHLKEQLNEKCKDLSRLDFNIKTHETTAKIQTKMISRLQKQKDDDNIILSEKEKQLEELSQKCITIENESVEMKNCIGALKHEIDSLKNIKQSLEERISQLELESEEWNRKPRLSIEAVTDQSRRRRQSIHDSKRIFDDKQQDHNKVESVVDGRSKGDDFFMDVDDNNSCRSTPVRHRRGCDSLQSKHEESSEEERPSRPGSVVAARQRRRSCHDLQRSVLDTPPDTQLSEQFRNKSRDMSKHDLSKDDMVNSRATELQARLSSCQQELEELKERYKELDDECETCAQYLRERDDQCARLKKEKSALEKIITELNEKLQSANSHNSRSNANVNFAHAAVNTDADWANLHSVVVDRMSFDAEVEKNKRLTKTVEELRFNKQELKIIVSKMQRALEDKPTKDGRELEKTRIELRSCKEELEVLKSRCKELDEECETCAQYLKERDEQCRRLKETIAALEAKIQELQENTVNVSHSLRKKRRTLHDLNRHSTTEYVDVSTQISEDFLSYQVERDSQPVTDDTHAKKRLNMVIEQLSQQKAALEQQLTAATTAPAYVATGSAIVQNQQLTDVIKENRKLKKINAELITLCRKRCKAVIKSNQENQDPAEEI